MENLPRFLTLIVKELLKNGFAEETEKLMELAIKKIFLGLAERAVIFLKDLIKKGIAYFNSFKSRFFSGSQNEKNETNNIFKIVFKVIVDFCSSFDFEKITVYIKAAIDLLKKLLGKFSEFKQWAFRKTTSTAPKPEECTTLCTLKNDTCTVPTSDIECTKIVPLNETWAIARTVEFVQKETIRSLVGTRKVTNTNFRGLERKIIYYVGNVVLGASPEDVEQYLTDLVQGGDFKCIKLKSNGRAQSFKVIANCSSRKILEDPQNWPEGVKVRQWVMKSRVQVNTRMVRNTMVIQNAIEPIPS